MKIEILASGSKGNCYKISNKNTSLLIEAGIPIKEIRKKLDYKLSDIDACLVTHEHMDHAKAANHLCNAGIDIYSSLPTLQKLGITKYNNRYFSFGKDLSYSIKKIGSIYVTPFPAVHDAIEPINFELSDGKETLIFMTDTAYCKYKFLQIDYLMIEVNYIKELMDNNVYSDSLNINLRNRIVKNHMSLETALEFLKANDLSRCKKIYVMHLSDNNSDEKIIKEEIQKLTGIPVEIC